MRFNNKNIIVALGGIAIVFIVGTIIFLNSPSTNAAGAWLSGWSYRKPHLINMVAGAGTDYQVKITVHYGSGTDGNGDVYLSGHSKTDFGDIRFTDDGGSTLLYYWMESDVNSDNAVFWVKVSKDLSLNNRTIYIYYGNALENTTSDGPNTFPFFDDFLGSSLDAAKWTATGVGTVTVSGGVATISGGSRIDGKTNFGTGYAAHWRGKLTWSDSQQANVGFRGEFGGAIDTDAFYIYGYGAISQWTFVTKKSGSTAGTAMNEIEDSNYHIFKLMRNSSASAMMQIDSGAVKESTTNVPIVSLPITAETRSTCCGGTVEADWVFVRKYVNPEPVQGIWGSEEVPTALPTPTPTPAGPTPWLSGWAYRKSHVVDAAPGAGTNYQVKITVHYGSGTDDKDNVYLSGHSQFDFKDIRFTDDTATNLLDYWIESKVDSDSAVVWVEVSKDLSSSNQTIYIYYGNSLVSTTSNGTNTFLFFDDFNDYTINPNKWYGFVANGGKVSTIETDGSPTQRLVHDGDGIDWWGADSYTKPALNLVNTALTFSASHYLHYLTAPTSKIYLIDNETVTWDTSFYALPANNKVVLVPDTETNGFNGDASFGPVKIAIMITALSNNSISYTSTVLEGTASLGTVNRSSGKTITGTINSPSLLFNTGEYGAGQVTYWDNIYLRKYVISEPVQDVWGPEQLSPVLTYISVVPANSTVTLGTVRQFTAVTLDQYGGTITASIGWVSSNPAVLSINASSGSFTASSVGTATVTASSGSVTGNTPITVRSVTTLAVTGWAWSENIGWISFNSANCDINKNNFIDVSCGGNDITTPVVKYGVSVQSTAPYAFFGVAWSPNIGWISFERFDTDTPPKAPDYNPDVARLSSLSAGAEVSGWARALSYGGGWDGWIKMKKDASDAGADYNVHLVNSVDFGGWAWGSDVVGWISFNCVDRGVCATSDYKVKFLNFPPDKPQFVGSGETWDNCSIQKLSIPIFNWTYSDPENDTQSAYRIQIDGAGSFASPMLDETINVASVTYSPAIDWVRNNLNWGATYYFRVKEADINGNWSVWSDGNPFTLPNHAYPWPDFDTNPARSSAGEQVKFIQNTPGVAQSICYDASNNAYSCQNGGAPISYEWDFVYTDPLSADSSTKGDVKYTYSTLGAYQAALRITDASLPGSCTKQKSINVLISLPNWREIIPIIFNSLDKIIQMVQNIPIRFSSMASFVVNSF